MPLKTVLNWFQKADRHSASGEKLNHIALDETVIQINDEQYWLYAAVNPDMTCLLPIRLFPMKTQALNKIFFSELHEKYLVDEVTFLVDSAPWLQAALHRHELRFQHEFHWNRNAVRHVFREVKR